MNAKDIEKLCKKLKKDEGIVIVGPDVRKN